GTTIAQSGPAAACCSSQTAAPVPAATGATAAGQVRGREPCTHWDAVAMLLLGDGAGGNRPTNGPVKDTSAVGRAAARWRGARGAVGQPGTRRRGRGSGPGASGRQGPRCRTVDLPDAQQRQLLDDVHALGDLM